jgi:hypothetical protein
MHAILMGDFLREMSVKKNEMLSISREWRGLEMSWRRERESKRPLLDEWPDIK